MVEEKTYNPCKNEQCVNFSFMRVSYYEHVAYLFHGRGDASINTCLFCSELERQDLYAHKEKDKK